MEPAESVKNLGVILDVDNSMQWHMANLCHICYYHLRELQLKGPQVIKLWNNCEGGKCLGKQSPGLL